jgi:hypothetical protein
VFSGLLALAIVALVTLPGRGDKIDGATVISNTIKAMTEAKTLRVVGHSGSYGARGDEFFAKLIATPYEIWRGPDYSYSCQLKADGSRFSEQYESRGVNTGKREAWAYMPNDHTLYTARLDNAAVSPTDASNAQGPAYMHVLPLDKWNSLPDTAKSVKRISRGGRDVLVLSMESEEKYGFILNRVMEVDAQNYHVLSIKVYAHLGKIEPQLCSTVDNVEYDVPLPSDLLEPRVPAGTAVRVAKMVVEETSYSAEFWMYPDGHNRIYCGGVARNQPSSGEGGSQSVGTMGTGGTPAINPTRQ